MIIQKAYAKVNLFLNVVNMRKDGYHNLQMINAKIDLFDTVKIEDTNSEGLVVIQSNDLFLSNQSNIVFDTARYMIDTYRPQNGVKIEIEKKIPFGAGLGGNSADAAAIIKGISELFGLNLPLEEMMRIGRKFGADIPYCLVDYPAYVEGIGEKITKLDLNLSKYNLLLLNPKIFIATPEVFAEGKKHGFETRDISNILDSIRQNRMDDFISSMSNSLEAIACSLHPEMNEVKRLIIDRVGESGLVMTGSGSTYIKLFNENIDKINAFVSEYRDKYFVNIYHFL